MRRRFRLSLLIVLVALAALPPGVAIIYSMCVESASELALRKAKQEMIRDLPFNDFCVLTPLKIRQQRRSFPWGRSSDREAVLHVHLTATLCNFDSEHSLFYVFHDPTSTNGQGEWFLAPYVAERERLQQDLFDISPTTETATEFERMCDARIEAPNRLPQPVSAP